MSRDRARAFERFSSAVDSPMLVLALLMLPLLIIPALWDDAPPTVRASLLVLDYAIWAAFAVEYAVMVVLAPRRWVYVRGHVPDLVLVAVPVLRPLRVVRSARALRLLRTTRLLGAVTKAARGSRRDLPARATALVVVATGLLLLVGGAVVYDLEHDAPGANIRTFGDALWWAFVAVTTVGYGDHFPTTTAGKAIGGGLTVMGIALVGVITASIAAYFVDHAHAGGDDVPARLARIEESLALLTAAQRSHEPGPHDTRPGSPPVPDDPGIADAGPRDGRSGPDPSSAPR